MTEEATVKSEYKDIYEISYDGWSDYLQQAETDLAYYCGAQFTWEDLKRAEDQGRTLHTLDKLARQVNLLHGYEIRNRHILKIGPVGVPEEREDEACRQHTALLMTLMARNGGYSALSNSFKWGTLVQGSNLLEFWRDRDGLLQFNRLGWNQFLLNPSLTQTDLSDCDDILTGAWVSLDKLKILVPTADIDGITPLTHKQRWPYLGDPELGNKAKNRMFEQWWHRQTKSEPWVISRVSSQELNFSDFSDKFHNGDGRAANRQIKELRQPNGAPYLSKYNKPFHYIELKVFVDGELVWQGSNPLKMRDYNFVWFHGDWCPELPRDELKLRSFVRRLREPQRAFNRRMNQIYDIIESQIQAGRVTRSKYLMNPEDAYKSGQGVVLQAKPDYPDQMALDNLIYQFTGADVPQGMFQALEMTDKAETDTGGLNQEIFGSDDKDIPGILHSYRTGQALTGQAGMFQGFRDSKTETGRKLVRLVQLNYPEKMVSKILNEIPIQDFYAENLIRFNCTPVEGLLTDTQQQLFYQELKMLRQSDPTFQQLIPASLMVKYFPGMVGNELERAVQQAEQQQSQIAQEARQLQTAQQQMEMERVKGEILANRGIAESQRAKAVEDITDAAYNRAKTAAEIEDMARARVLELLQMAISLETVNQQNLEVKAKS